MMPFFAKPTTTKISQSFGSYRKKKGVCYSLIISVERSFTAQCSVLSHLLIGHKRRSWRQPPPIATTNARKSHSSPLSCIDSFCFTFSLETIHTVLRCCFLVFQIFSYTVARKCTLLICILSIHHNSRK